jgi:hypothetical protein
MAEKTSENCSQNLSNSPDMLDEGINTPPHQVLDEYDILHSSSSSEDEVLIDEQADGDTSPNKQETSEKPGHAPCAGACPSRPRALSTKSVDVVAKEITCPRVNCPEKMVRTLGN